MNECCCQQKILNRVDNDQTFYTVYLNRTLFSEHLLIFIAHGKLPLPFRMSGIFSTMTRHRSYIQRRF